MSDKKFDELIDLYAAGELDSEARRAVEAHLEEHPEQMAALEAARERQSALEARLREFRVSDEFVARTMASVLATASLVQREPEPPPERLITRLFRYAATAAAAVLLLAGSYGMMRQPPAGRIARGSAVRVNANRTAPAEAGMELACGDVVKTPANAGDFTRISLAQGRLRGALAPGSRLLVCDERMGRVAVLQQGDLFWRADSARAAPVVDSPLVRVAAVDGDMSLHVKPSPQEAGSRFRGTVVLAAHRGAARVIIPGSRRGPLVVRGGQMLTLQSGVRRAIRPQDPEIVSRQLLQHAAQKKQAQQALRSKWELLSNSIRSAPADAQRSYIYEAARLQSQMDQLDGELTRIHQTVQRLEHYRTHGQKVFLRLASDEQ